MSTKLQQVAKTSFIKEISKQVKWLAESCWPDNLEYNLAKLNQVVEAARSFEVTALEPLTEAEVKELARVLKPLRAIVLYYSGLEMKEEAREVIISLLEKKGLERDVFHPVIVDQTPA